MDKRIKELAEKLNCKILNRHLYAPDGFHFKEVSFHKTHEINLGHFSDDGIYHLLLVGLESCDEVPCVDYRGKGLRCKFWQDVHDIMDKNLHPIHLTDEQTLMFFETLKELKDRGYNGLYAIKCLPEIFEILDISIKGLEEGAILLKSQAGLHIAEKLKKAVDNFKIKEMENV